MLVVTQSKFKVLVVVMKNIKIIGREVALMTIALLLILNRLDSKHNSNSNSYNHENSQDDSRISERHRKV